MCPIPYTLEHTATGRPTKTGELKFTSSRGEVPPAVTEAARGWFNAHQQTEGCQHLTVLHQLGGWWWAFAVFEATEEDGPGVAVARLSNVPGKGDVVSLLHTYFQACPRPWTGSFPARIEVDRDQPEAFVSDRLAAAALELALFGRTMLQLEVDRDRPRCQSAAILLHSFSVDKMDWIARVGGAYPADPPAGRGLFLHRNADEQWDTRVDVSRIVAQSRPATIWQMPLVPLAELRETPDTRVLLVKAVLGWPAVELPANLTPPSLRWLARYPHGRRYALQCAPPGRVGEVLALLRELSADEARLLAGKARPEHADAVAGLLAQSPTTGRFQAFHHAFPQEQRARLELLQPHVRKVWEALESDEPGGPDLPAKDVNDFLAVLQDVKDQVRPRTTLPGLVRGARGGHPKMRAWLGKWLREKEGLPAELIDALLDGSAPTTALPVLPPPPAGILERDMSWLRAINPAVFLGRCAAWLYQSAWGRWWHKGLGPLAREPGNDRKGLEVVAALTDPKAERVAFPPADWPDGANLLVRKMYEDGSLWRRIRPFGPGEALPALAWLYQALVSNCPEISACYHALERKTPLAPHWLRRLGPLLPRLELLDQVVVWANTPFDPEQDKALEALFGLEALKGEQARWLRALLGLGRLGPVPTEWGPRDLLALLPLLDPVRDVLREVFSWPAVTGPEAEAQLLEAVCQRLEKERIGPEMLLPTPEQRDLRPRWVERLRKLPGWVGFTPAAPRADALPVTVVAPFDPFAPPPHKQPKA